MDRIATAAEAADEGRQHPAAPEAGHLRADDADTDTDRLRAGAASHGLGEAAPNALLDPPSPDAVVAVSLRHAAAPEERAREREAALRARHAAEVARLRAALRAMEEAHAAEVGRLRAEHAAELARAAEAHRRAPDAARTGAERRSGPEESGASGLRARQPVRQQVTTRGRLARLTGRGRSSPPEPWGRLSAKPFAGADLIAAVRALRPAGAAALSRLRGAVPPPR
jgi:hypothetical protein